MYTYEVNTNFNAVYHFAGSFKEVLDEPFAKLNHAKYLLNLLDSEEAQYFKSDFYKTKYTEENKEESIKAVLDIYISPATETYLCLISDIIHNCRASLDILACVAVRENGENPKNVHFPFAISEIELDKQIRRKKFDKAGELCVAVLKRLKPYRGGNEILRAIHDLDIMGKHRLIVPTWAQIPNSVPDFQYSLVDGSMISASLNKDFKIDFVFPADTAFQGKKILTTLDACIHECEGVIEAFRPVIIG